jgi:hypothetical protein
MMGLMLTLLALLFAAALAPENATVEYRQPQMAADAKIVAVTFGAGNAIYFAASRDQGRTLSAPVKVAEAPLLSLGRHRGPRIAITRSAIVISAVVGTKTPPGSDGDLKAWRSTDGGKTWSSGVAINDKTAAAREGLHAMAAGPDGRLFAAWLDDRDGRKKLYSATSTDGAAWSKNVLVYESPSGAICECCHPSAAIDAKGTIYVMWRNALDGNRDMYLAGSTDGGATFSQEEKLGSGSWKLNACPMDGGGLAISKRGGLVSIWRRESDVYLAEPESPEQKIEAGKDASVTIGSAGVYAVWSANGAIHARMPGQAQPVELAAQGGFPQVITLPDGSALAAWEDHGRIELKKL